QRHRIARPQPDRGGARPRRLELADALARRHDACQARHRRRLHHDLHAGGEQLRRAGDPRRPGQPLVHRDHLRLVLRRAELEPGIGIRLHPADPLHRLHPADDAGLQGPPRGYREMTGRGSSMVMKIYLTVFFIYLYVPLVIMGAATFNSSRFPTVTPWLGTTLKW